MRDKETKDKEYMKVIECPAVKGLLREKDCNTNCQYFVKKEMEKVEQQDREGNTRQIPSLEFTICQFPKKRTIFPVRMIEGE